MLCLRRIMALSSALSVSLLLGSCKEKSAPKSSGASPASVTSASGTSTAGQISTPVDLTTLPGTTFKVTYDDHTVIVEEATVRKTLRSVSKNGNVLVFDPSPQIQKLEPGSVLLMQGLSLRKVLAVMPFESRTAVLTVPAVLTDAIKEGHMHWDYPVRFSSQSAGQESVGPARYSRIAPCLADLFRCLGSRTTPVVYAADAPPGSIHGTVKGWDVWADATVEANRVRIQVQAKREEAGLHALLTGDGYLQNFDTSSDIEIHDSKLTDLRWSNKNLNGVMNFSWEVAKEKPGVWAEEDPVPLPTSFKQPLIIGGLPLTLTVEEALLIHPALTQANQLSEAHFRLEYNGYSRFSLHSGNIDDDGQVTGETTIVNTRALSPVAAHAFVATLAAPRLGLKFGISSAWEALEKVLPTDLAESALQAFLSNPYVQKAMGTPDFQKALEIVSEVKDAVKTALKSDAAVHLDFIIAGNLLDSGPLTPGLGMVHCTRAQVVVTVQGVANAEVLAQPIAQATKVLARYTKSIGPKTGPCA
ncbi:MAG TPA: hypothetical protein VIX37_23060 [Candidatus Sulfotelmatobacter sp.]